MSEDRHNPRRLAQELAQEPGAIPVLVTLLEAGGVAEQEKLRLACAPDRADDAIRWLTAARLVRRHDRAGGDNIDDPADTYELTNIGHALINSLNALVTACANPATPGKTGTIGIDPV
jgi:hypothetical protein